MAKPSVRNMEKVGHLFNLTEKNQTIGTEFIELLDEVGKVYEHLQEVSSVAHQAKHFSIAIFGSARVQSDCPEFTFVSKLTRSIVEKIEEVDIVICGGAGIMEVANKGIVNASGTPYLKEATKAISWGLHVQRLDYKPNPFLHVEKYHKHFTTRL